MIAPLIIAVGITGVSYMLLGSTTTPVRNEGGVSFENDIPEPKVSAIADTKTKAIEATQGHDANYALNEFDFSALSRKDSVVSINSKEYSEDQAELAREKELSLRRTDSIYQLMLNDVNADNNPVPKKQEYSHNKANYIQAADELERELLGDTEPKEEKPKQEQKGNNNKSNGFNSLTFSPGGGNSSERSFNSESTSIPAVILNDVIVKNGGNVQIRVLETVKINGYSLKRNTSITGTASINGNRLLIKVPGSNVGGELVDVEFNVYDYQGVEGIYIEGMSKKEASGDIQDEAINQVGQNIPGASGGILGGVINVARNIGGRSRSEQRIAVPGGSKILLKYTGNN